MRYACPYKEGNNIKNHPVLIVNLAASNNAPEWTVEQEYDCQLDSAEGIYIAIEVSKEWVDG